MTVTDILILDPRNMSMRINPSRIRVPAIPALSGRRICTSVTCMDVLLSIIPLPYYHLSPALSLFSSNIFFSCTFHFNFPIPPCFTPLLPFLPSSPSLLFPFPSLLPCPSLVPCPSLLLFYPPPILLVADIGESRHTITGSPMASHVYFW